MSLSKTNLRQLSKNIQEDIDLFVCCGSFENRSVSIAKSLRASKIKQVIIAENKNFSRYTSTNTTILRELFKGRYIDADIATDNPIKSADSLIKAFKNVKFNETSSIVIDITTFTHESLLILIAVILFHKIDKKNIIFSYVNAKDYSFNVHTVKDKWLSKGVSDIRSILGFPGNVFPNRKNHLIILVGFEYERATMLIERFEPARITLGFGKTETATSKNNIEAEAHFRKLVRETTAIYGNVGEFEFSHSDPIDAKDKILDHVDKYENYNSIVAPMNTKLSTIGCALAALENTSIQLCYAQPVLYNFHGYSQAGDTVFIVELKELLSTRRILPLSRV